MRTLQSARSTDVVVVFDPPYTDISRAPGVRGVVAWGAHDPGVASTSSPPELRRDLHAYPLGPTRGGEWTYLSPWPSAKLTAEMGAALVRGLGARREAARWLLAERIADWDLAIVVAGEPHSAAEAFWHGIDPTHPLHGHPSACGSAASVPTYTARRTTAWSATSSPPLSHVRSSCSPWAGWAPTTPTRRAWCSSRSSSIAGPRGARCSTCPASGLTIRAACRSSRRGRPGARRSRPVIRDLDDSSKPSQVRDAVIAENLQQPSG